MVVMAWLEIVLLTLIFFAALLLGTVLENIPDKELHRRSRSDLPGQSAAKRLGRLSAYGIVAKGFIWLLAIASIAILLIWAFRTSVWLAVAVLVFENLAGVVADKLVEPGNLLFNLAGLLAGGVAWFLHWFDPLIAKLPKPKTKAKHSRLYESEDVIELLERQARQTDNRIDPNDLKTVKSALGFGSKKVSDLAVKLNEVRLVLPDESVGPHLMDELYASGHSAFPVGKKVGKKLPPELSGLVYMEDLVANPLQGSVSQLMSRGLTYITGDLTLEKALELFLMNHTSLVIVNNERDEPEAVLWLEDVLSQLLGRKLKVQAETPADADAREKMIE